MICNNSVYIPHKLFSDFITEPSRLFTCMFSAALALQRDDYKTHTHIHTHTHIQYGQRMEVLQSGARKTGLPSRRPTWA